MKKLIVLAASIFVLFSCKNEKQKECKKNYEGTLVMALYTDDGTGKPGELIGYKVYFHKTKNATFIK